MGERWCTYLDMVVLGIVIRNMRVPIIRIAPGLISRLDTHAILAIHTMRRLMNHRPHMRPGGSLKSHNLTPPSRAAHSILEVHNISHILPQPYRHPRKRIRQRLDRHGRSILLAHPPRHVAVAVEDGVLLKGRGVLISEPQAVAAPLGDVAGLPGRD